MKRMSDVITV